MQCMVCVLQVRDTFVVVDALHHVLDYSRKLANYANDDDLIPGLGMPSIHGGPWDADNRKRDVRDAYKLYVDESVAREVSEHPELTSSKVLAAVTVSYYCEYKYPVVAIVKP